MVAIRLEKYYYSWEEKKEPRTNSCEIIKKKNLRRVIILKNKAPKTSPV